MKHRGERRGGGTVLTPACLFYLGAQHGYRCCAAPSHRDMTASLCFNTLSLSHTHTLSSPGRCCLALLLLILFVHLSPLLTLLHLESVCFHTHTHAHTRAYTHLQALNHTLSSSCPLSFRLTPPLCPTGPACCCSHIPRALPTLTLSL